MIRRCASTGCGFLVRWHAYCPAHRHLAPRPDQPDRRASTTPAPEEHDWDRARPPSRARPARSAAAEATEHARLLTGIAVPTDVRQDAGS